MNTSRLERVIENMKRAGLEQILVSAPHSVYYLTGLFIYPGERMLALLVKSNGETRLFANRLFALAGKEGVELSEYDDTDDPVALLSSYLDPGTVGVDKLWPSHFTIRLMEARGDIRIVNGSAPVDDARLIKDEDEIRLMKASSLANDKTLGELIPTIKQGDTELGVGERYLKIGKKHGASGASFDSLVCFGSHCAEPHHSSDDTVLKENQSVILDVGLNVNNMMSDMTRTVFFGKADDEFKKVYDIVKKANEAGRAAARPGVMMKDIDFAARKVIEDAGYGKYFIHRTGHGIGLEVHEPTDVSAANEFIAQKGMCFSIEPGIYLPGKFGVRIEDLVALTDDGALVLNELPRELIEIR